MLLPKNTLIYIVNIKNSCFLSVNLIKIKQQIYSGREIFKIILLRNLYY